MSTTRKPSPARSQGAVTTPRPRRVRNTRSVGSPARSNASGRLTAVIQFPENGSFFLSPMPTRRSVLNDDTNIEEPRRKSWWKNLGDNSRDVIELLDDNIILKTNEAVEEYMDIEVLSQEKNFTLDLPESSDSESISSIVIPQRKLFTHKENQAQNKFGQLVGNRESMAKLQKSTIHEKSVHAPPKKLFNQGNKPKTKPVFPAALLNLSQNKTANKTKEMAPPEVKGEVRSLFGNRPGTKRKNMFADFIVSESEDEISDIQPKVFGFHKNVDKRRESAGSRGKRDPSPTSSITTDVEMDEWKLLPSSTMVEHQFEDMMAAARTPVKRARLSKLTETKESEQTEPEEKSILTRSRSKASPKLAEVKRNKSSIANLSKRQSKVENEANKNKTQTETSIKLNNTENKVNKSLEQNNTKIKNNTSTQNKSQTNIDSSNRLDKTQNEVNKSSKTNKTQSKADNLLTENEINKVSMSEDGEVIEEVVLEEDDEMHMSLQYDEHEENDKETDKIQHQHQRQNVNMIIEHEHKSNNQQNQKNDFMLGIDIDEVQQKLMHKDKIEIAKPEDNITHHNHKTQEVTFNNNKNQESVIQKGLEAPEPITELEQEIETLDQLKDDAHQLEENSGDQKPNDNYNNVNEFETEVEDNEQQDKAKKRNIINQDTSVHDNEEDKCDEQNQVNNIDHEKKLHYNDEEKSNEHDQVDNVDQEASVNDNDEAEEIQDESEEHDQVDALNKSDELSEEIREEEETEEDLDQESQVSEDDSEIKGKSFQQDDSDEEMQENQEEKDESHEQLEEDQEELEENQEMDESPEQVNASAAQIDDEDHGPNEDQENEMDDQEDEIKEGDEIEVNVDENKKKGNKGQEQVDVSMAHDEEMEEHVDISEKQIYESEHQSDKSEKRDDESQEQVDVSMAQVRELEEQVDESEEQIDESEEQADESQEEVDQSQENVDENPDQNESKEETQEEDESDDDQDESDQGIEDTDEREPQNNDEEIEESEERQSPNETHDTTGRHRNKEKSKVNSPEAILLDKTNQVESFIVKGRNTSLRRTSIMKSLNIRPSLAPHRDSTDLSDGSRNSGGGGSGWDSHRTTRKTLRQTFGKDFTPRKSLRALVMEKSAKRQTAVNDLTSVTSKFPQANSTELPEASDFHYDEEVVETNHDLSKRTRQTTLEMYLQKIKKQNIENKLKMEEEVRNSLKTSNRNILNPLKVPSKPMFALRKSSTKGPTKSKAKQKTNIIPLDDLPPEVLEDMKYKPPKRFQPSNAAWITKRLYKFLENKLEAKYDYKARVRAEKVVQSIYDFAKDLRRHEVASHIAVDELKQEMARLDIVKTHFEFYQFFHEYMPREIRVKVVPDVVNKIPLPRHGVFTDILRGNTVQG